MIAVKLKEPTSREWKSWIRKTKLAQKKLLADARSGRPIRISKLYKEQKQILFAAFHGKCAYCEAKIQVDQPGDIDHFRPKAGITDEQDDAILLPPDRRGRCRRHPGYFWLAYEWTNLLPACAACNRPSKSGANKRAGKWNRFPVVGKHATKPEEIMHEQPLLLNPLNPQASDDPSKHIELDVATGYLFGTTSRGQACIRILQLNREGLPEIRKSLYNHVSSHVRMSLISNNIESDYAASFTPYHDGSAPYSFVGRRAIADLVKVTEQRLAMLNRVTPKSSLDRC